MSNTMIKGIAVFYDIYLNKSSGNFRPIPCAKFFYNFKPKPQRAHMHVFT